MFIYNKKDFIFAAAKWFIVGAIFFCKFIENIENDSAYQYRYKLANQTFWNIVNSESYNLLKYYNEEFDPGSGWTLAAGFIHASRGAA